MFFGVEVVALEQVMVDILRGDIDFHAVGTHRLKFQHHERAENILEEYLVDAEGDFLSRLHAAPQQTRAYQFLCDIERHDPPPTRKRELRERPMLLRPPDLSVGNWATWSLAAPPLAKDLLSPKRYRTGLSF